MHLTSGDDPSWLHRLRDVVQGVLDADTDPELATLYLVAVTEIVVNAEEVHQRGNVAEPVAAEVDADRRRVTVIDHGGGFDLSEHSDRAQPTDPRGRGLHLARSFCPDLSASRTDDGMRFTLPFPPVGGGVSRLGG